MTVVDDLQSAGVNPRLSVDQTGRSSIDGVLELVVDGHSFVFAIEQRARAPYPNEVDQLGKRRAQTAAMGLPLLAAPFVSTALGDALSTAGWSWADEQGNYSLVAPGLRLRSRTTKEPSRVNHRQLPRGSGSGTIIRQLIHGWRQIPFPSVTDLAIMAKVSQPRASQVLAQLMTLGFVSKSGRGEWTVVDREALLDHFLTEYRGPGGSERLLYSLDPPLITARRVAEAAGDGDLAVSADVGPDLIAPWRRPTVLVLYTRGELSQETSGAVPTVNRDIANVIVRTPRDQSVFPVRRLVADYHDVEIPLADPVQMIWDLQALGGTEREEAAGVMRAWILNQP